MRYSFRAVIAAVAGAACLTLAACSSSSGSTVPSGPRPVSGGTVTVREGTKVICVMKVVNGKGTCKVPAKTIGVGTKALVGEYQGAGYRKSQSQPLSVTVTHP